MMYTLESLNTIITDWKNQMAKIINIHTGEEVIPEKIPMDECNVCGVEFSLKDEGGINGYFGILPVKFCPTCLSSMLDMAKHLLGLEEKDDE